MTTSNTIFFTGTAYTIESLEDMKGSQLVSLHNEAAKVLDEHLVKRFADKKTAVKRTWKLLEALPAPKAAPKQEVKMTDAEFTALKACTTYDNRAQQLEDNHSSAGQEEIEKVLGWNDKQVSALIGSLEAKGLAESDNEGANGDKFNTVWLTEKGANAVFDAIEAGREEKAPAPKQEKAAPAPKKARSKGTNLAAPGHKPIACREASKQALLLDALAQEGGATMEELIEALSGGKKPWTEATVRSGFGWDMKQKGYGVRSTFDEDGTERFHIVVPEGHVIPAHRPLKSAPKAEK